MDVNAWIGAGIGIVVVAVVTSVVVGAVAGVAVASWGRFPMWVGVLVCVLVPVLGPAVLAVVALARSSGGGEEAMTLLGRGRWTVRGAPVRGRRVRLGLLAGGLALLGALLVVPVARLHAGAAFSTPVLLPALPGGGETMAVTFALAVAVAALAVRRPTRLGAIGGAVLGGAWAVLAASVLLLSVPLTGVLHLADRYLGNMIGGFVLQILRSYEVPAADIASGVRDSVSTRLDAGVWVALAGAVLLVAWSVAEVVSAHRAVRGPATVLVALPSGVPVQPVVAQADGWSF